MANEKLSDYLRDLLTLEVTTIVVDRIPEHVTLDLKTQLRVMGDEWANDAARRRGDTESSATTAPRGTAPAKHRSLHALFATIASAGPAVRAPSRSPREVAASTETVGVRTKGDEGGAEGKVASPAEPAEVRRAERAKLIRDLLPSDDQELDVLPEKARIALRRMATLGDCPISAHTTLSVNGDLVNLIAADLAKPEYADVRRMHAEGVTNAIGWWNSVAAFVRDVLGSLLDAIASTKRSTAPVDR